MDKLVEDKIIMNEIIQIPILNNAVMVHFGDVSSLKEEIYSRFGTEKGIEIFNELHFDKSINGKSAKLCTGQIILWLPEIPKDIDAEGVLAHEIFHTAVTIMLSRDIQLSNDTEELCAYLIGFLTIQIKNLIKKKYER